VKNLITFFLGIAFAVSGIAYLQVEKANRRLAEQLQQVQEKAKIVETEVATLRNVLQMLTDAKHNKAAESPLPELTLLNSTPSLPPGEQPRPAPGDTEQTDHKPAIAEEISEAEKADSLAIAVDKYAGLIKRRVEQVWRIPQGIPSHLGCLVKIELMPSGEVQNIKVVESSGNAIFDNSAITAVKKASPLPLPADPKAAAKFRNFNFRFSPSL
jgi:colicin import membrane protein